MPKTTWLLALPYPALFALVYYYEGTYNFLVPFAFLLLGILFLFGTLSLIAPESKKNCPLCQFN